MLEILNYSFITNALISALFIGPLLGIIGTLVVSKKMAFYSEAIGHAAMTGIAIGIILELFDSLLLYLWLFYLIWNFDYIYKN